MLFLIVMDSLVCHLSTSGLDLSINGHNIGSAHADDIRSTSNSIADLQGQGAIIEHFALDNLLKLIASKTELIKFSANAFISEGIQLTSHLISTQPTAKLVAYKLLRVNCRKHQQVSQSILCLGFHWCLSRCLNWRQPLFHLCIADTALQQ